ncbi:MAG: virulence-associated E family protein [Ruminococcaceae bacterium]|nr:virulence-associated E family protein [Oscillospiraceae bacterium]
MSETTLQKPNRSLMVYTANSRKNSTMQAAPTDVIHLFERLSLSQALPCTSDEYRAMKKGQQDDLKDVGAYIIGELRGGKRRNGSVLSRGAIVLDADNLPAGSTEDAIKRVACLGLCCCIYSTAKHTPATPRLRIIIPLSEDIPAEWYAPIGRILCKMIQPEMTWFDPTCDQAGRIMYYPSHCSDVSPVFYTYDGNGLLDGAALLAQSPDWENAATWPRFPREVDPAKLAARAVKQQDPTEKQGIVGAFCRTYDIPAAMEKFLPGVYEETTSAGRYTFTEGSSWGGAVVYEDGKFLYSNHATDPCSKQLVNAWDLVRLHLFGDLDDEAKDGTRGISLPSFKAMEDYARKDPDVTNALAREAFDRAFTDTPAQDEDAALALGGCAGEALSLPIMRTVLRAMGITLRRNLITFRAEIEGLPGQYSKEEAVNTLPVLVMDRLRAIGVKGVTKAAVRDYLVVIADENRYNPVLDMMHMTRWDGTQRFRELMEIVNIDPESFHALLFRKWLIQSVAMAHNTPEHIEPGEGVLTLQGEQGAGKTAILRKLAVKPDWMSEGVSLDMRNKDDLIRAVSAWITELGEVDSTLRREQTSLKAFITQTVDKIRMPYAAEQAHNPRRTSFGATVNPQAFLKDDTGDRRFWVIPIAHVDLDRLFDLTEDWFIQLWAEVYIWWQLNPKGFRLSPEERLHLNEINSAYREDLPWEDEIRAALNFDLPADQWSEFSASSIGHLLALGSYRVEDATKIGRALAKLTREDKRITSRLFRGRTLYRLPVQSTTPAPSEVG